MALRLRQAEDIAFNHRALSERNWLKSPLALRQHRLTIGSGIRTEPGKGSLRCPPFKFLPVLLTRLLPVTFDHLLDFFDGGHGFLRARAGNVYSVGGWEPVVTRIRESDEVVAHNFNRFVLN